MGQGGEGAEERGGRGSGLVMQGGEGAEERGGRGSGLVMPQYWWEVRGRGQRRGGAEGQVS